MIINTIEYVQNQHKITKMIHLPVSVAGQLRTTPDIFFHPATVWCPTMVCFEGCQGFSYTRRPPARFHGKSISFGQRRGTCRVSMTKSWTEKVHLFAVCRWAEKKEDTRSSRKKHQLYGFFFFQNHDLHSCDMPQWHSARSDQSAWVSSGLPAAGVRAPPLWLAPRRTWHRPNSPWSNPVAMRGLTQRIPNNDPKQQGLGSTQNEDLKMSLVWRWTLGGLMFGSGRGAGGKFESTCIIFHWAYLVKRGTSNPIPLILNTSLLHPKFLE